MHKIAFTVISESQFGYDVLRAAEKRFKVMFILEVKTIYLPDFP